MHQRIAELERQLAEAQQALALQASGPSQTPAHAAQAPARRLQEQQHEMFRVLSSVQSAFIADSDSRALFNGLLDNLLSLTRSEYGFIDEVLYRDEQPYLRSLALTNISWNAETQAFYDANVATGMEFTNLKTLFGAALTSGKPVVTNKAATDPRRGGLPPGHPALNAFLGIPIYGRDVMIGMIGIANGEGGYDETTIEFLQPFLRTCATIIEAFRGERRRKAAELAQRDSEEKNRALLRAIPDLILLVRRDGTVLHCKPPSEPTMGIPTDGIVGRNVRDVLPAWAEHNIGHIERALDDGEVVSTEYATGADGVVRYHECQIGRSGPDEVLAVVRDVTMRRRAEEERQRLQDDLIRAQAASLAELSTPLIPINEDVVIMPLIGTVDGQRAEQVITTLLDGVTSRQARVAILDITGVSIADAQVANALLRAAQAVKLIGARTVLTGMRPEVARTLVELGMSMGDIVTCGTLQSGIAYAMQTARKRGGGRPGNGR
jgi:PAS domain S-box-containing protein